VAVTIMASRQAQIEAVYQRIGALPGVLRVL
jgi:putative lipoic acid-binding regulatory protein